MERKKILLTAFEPFGRLKKNLTEEILGCFIANPPSGFALCPVLLPCRYGAAWDRLREAILSEKPDVILCLGLASRAAKISLERFALNIDDSSARDNDGCARRGISIRDDSPHALKTDAPLQEILRILKKNGILARISNHAGAFVCNHLYYEALHYLQGAGSGIPALFVHIPGRYRKTGKSKGKTTKKHFGELARAVELVMKTYAGGFGEVRKESSQYR